MEYNKECDVQVVFDLNEVPLKAVLELEELFRSSGVQFAARGESGERVWDWYFTENDPIKVLFWGDSEEHQKRVNYGSCRELYLEPWTYMPEAAKRCSCVRASECIAVECKIYSESEHA